jgi:transposase-like protein
VRGEVTLGGRRIALQRLRARSVEDGSEVCLPSFAWAAKRDPLERRTMEAVAIGVSSRRYARSLDPLPPIIEECSTAKSSVSRRFVARSAALLEEWLGRPLDELELTVVMIDGIFLDERCVLIALGIDTQGRKQVLGLHEGSTENAPVARALIRTSSIGVSIPASRCCSRSTGAGVRTAIRSFWEERAVIHRCQVQATQRGHHPAKRRGRVMAAMASSRQRGPTPRRRANSSAWPPRRKELDKKVKRAA